MMVDKNILEFWGQTFLNTARTQQQMEDMNKIIEQYTGVDNQFINSLFNAFSWQNPVQKNTECFLELYEKLSREYNDLIKAYLTMFNVVSEKKHLSVIKENEELKVKISELEKIIDKKINPSDEISYYPKKIVDNLTQAMSDQTHQFQELLKQLNQPIKKATITKKNKT